MIFHEKKPVGGQIDPDKRSSHKGVNGSKTSVATGSSGDERR